MQADRMLIFRTRRPNVHLFQTRRSRFAYTATIAYIKRLPRAERVNIGVGIKRFTCYDLCDIQHVKLSREMTSLVLKQFGLRFA